MSRSLPAMIAVLIMCLGCNKPNGRTEQPPVAVGQVKVEGDTKPAPAVVEGIQHGEAARRDSTRTVDFAETLKSAGFNLSQGGIEDYVKYRTAENMEKVTSKKGGDTRQIDPIVQKTIYSYRTKLEVDWPGYYMRGSNAPRGYGSISVTFRPEFHAKNVKATGQIESAVPFWAQLQNHWYLTKNKTLRECRNKEEVNFIVQEGGLIYFPDTMGECYIQLKVSDEIVKAVNKEKQVIAVVEFDSLRVSEVAVWGFYKAETLNADYQRYDCDAIRRWHDVGLDDTEKPVFFRSSRNNPKEIVTARVLKVRLEDEIGKELGLAVMNQP